MEQLPSLIADATEMLPPWASGTAMITAVLGGPLFAIWYAWYVTTRVIPDKEKAFALQLKESEDRCTSKFEAMEQRHADHMDVETRNNREDMKLAWDTNKASSERIAAVLERLADKIDQSCRYGDKGYGSG